MKTVRTRRLNAGTTVLAPSGELDLAAVPELRARLSAVCRPGRVVVLDLQDVVFMDSSALSVVLSADRFLRASGGALRLAHVAEDVLRVLRICGLADGLVRPSDQPAGTSSPDPRAAPALDLVR